MMRQVTMGGVMRRLEAASGGGLNPPFHAFSNTETSNRALDFEKA